MRHPQLRNYQSYPPKGGWRIEIMIKGQQFNFGGMPNDIVSKIFDIKNRNGEDTTIDEVWNYCNEIWCSRDPDRCYSGSVTNNPSITQRIADFGRTLFKLKQAGKLHAVSQEEANRRAEVCIACPRNGKHVNCGSCAAAAKVMTRKLIGKRATKHDVKLKQCGICWCELKQKIHFPIIPDGKPYPDNCWQNESE